MGKLDKTRCLLIMKYTNRLASRFPSYVIGIEHISSPIFKTSYDKLFGGLDKER